MTDFHTLPDQSKRLIVEQTALQRGLSNRVVEKDLWVSTILEVIFTLPFADKLLFKGGTSLSKVWGLIDRFSEDIDLAVDRRLFKFEGDLTVRQLKQLRKISSLFVYGEFCEELRKSVKKFGLDNFLTILAQPNGEGDKTYPEPRRLYIGYTSLFEAEVSYIKPQIIIEVGARSLFEPAKNARIKSMISERFPNIQTSVVEADVLTAVPAKTFLEKAFLLHELFSTDASTEAYRKSRHLYDLERMMDREFAVDAVLDNGLWNMIHHHREVFTHMRNVDYEPDIRDRIMLTPPPEHYQTWANDYAEMQSGMIYGDSISFDKLIERMKELETRFKNRSRFS